MKAIKPIYLFAIVILLLTACDSKPAHQDVNSLPDVAVKGMVTLVDVGSVHCKPCQMMMPVLDVLKEKYAGKAVVKFLNSDMHRDEALKLKVMTIPTQIIFDSKGREVLRHIGFFPQVELEKAMDKVLGEDK